MYTQRRHYILAVLAGAYTGLLHCHGGAEVLSLEQPTQLTHPPRHPGLRRLHGQVVFYRTNAAYLLTEEEKLAFSDGNAREQLAAVLSEPRSIKSELFCRDRD